MPEQEPKPAWQISQEIQFNERLKTAYGTAMRAGHDGGRVEVHLGSDVLEYLKTFILAPKPAWVSQETIWGFPVVETTAAPDHISVHVITIIA